MLDQTSPSWRIINNVGSMDDEELQITRKNVVMANKDADKPL